MTGAADTVDPEKDPSKRMQNRSNKRRKIALACDECRERKVRCDGAQPVCGTCNRRHRGQKLCSYPSDLPKSAIDRRYMQSLHDRIRHLESICRVQQPHAIPPNPLQPPVSPDKEPSPGWNSEDQTGAGDEMQSSLLLENDSAGSGNKRGSVTELEAFAMLSNMDGPAVKSSMEAAPDEQESPVNAMGTASVGYHRMQTDSEGFYGKSSAASFFNQVQEVFYRCTGKSPYQFFTAPTRSRNRSDMPFLAQSFDTDILDNYSLPPRATADKLLGLYRRRVYSLYPFIHWQTLLGGYNRLWNPDGEIGETPDGVGLGAPDCPLPAFYSALNIMFALGLQFSDEPFAKREAMSKVFFRRSRRLCHIDILDRGNLALVQTLLTMAQYLQSTNLPNRCWNVVGLACRVAQGLGLHLQDGDESRSRLAVEIRRRTWHACVLLDTVLSMTLGRPATMSYESAVPLPVAIDDEYLMPGNHGFVQPEDIFARTTFFVQTLKLNKILSEVLSKVYNPWNEALKSADGQEDRVCNQVIAVAMELDTKLAKFEKDLPAAFRWVEVNPEELRPDSLVQLQRNVLGERFFLIRGLLYRPMFISLCLGEIMDTPSSKVPVDDGLKAGVDLLSVFGRHSSTACIEAAQRLLRLVHMTADALGTGGGAWWYNLYYTFTSAMVLILADLCPSVRTTIDNASLSRSWQHCQDILTLMCNHSSAAREIFKVLQKMRTIIQPDLVSNIPDSRNSKTDGSCSSDRDRRGFVDQNISPVPDLPELDLSFDSALQQMGEPGLMDFLWKDCWTFASGDPGTWEVE